MDAQNLMDAGELAAVEAWKARHWKGARQCPICESKNWITNPRVGYITNEQTAVDGSAFPVVLIYCGTCSYTFTVNAIAARVRPATPFRFGGSP